MGMFETWCFPKRRRDALETVLVTVYCALSAYLFVCNSPPGIGAALREVIRPFQAKARARSGAFERSAAVWRLSQLESRMRRRLG